VSAPGDRFVAAVGSDRLDRAAAMNTRAGAHLWIIATSYGLTDQEAANGIEGVQVLLDDDHLLSVTAIGCYICEQPYSEAVGRRCKGEPVAYDMRTPIYRDGSRG
jgi:hypothetical protein